MIPIETHHTEGNDMGIFKHFGTLSQAKAYMREADPHGDSLTYQRKSGKHTKPYAVATRLEHLHFTPDAWVKKTRKETT